MFSDVSKIHYKCAVHLLGFHLFSLQDVINLCDFKEN